MKITINQNDFLDAFKKLRPNNFSYEGLIALYNYLEDYEQGVDEVLELDVIAFCCDYTEYENLEEYKKSYSSINSIDDIQSATAYISIPNSKRFITQNH